MCVCSDSPKPRIIDQNSSGGRSKSSKLNPPSMHEQNSDSNLPLRIGGEIEQKISRETSISLTHTQLGDRHSDTLPIHTLSNKNSSSSYSPPKKPKIRPHPLSQSQKITRSKHKQQSRERERERDSSRHAHNYRHGRSSTLPDRPVQSIHYSSKHVVTVPDADTFKKFHANMGSKKSQNI